MGLFAARSGIAVICLKTVSNGSNGFTVLTQTKIRVLREKPSGKIFFKGCCSVL